MAAQQIAVPRSWGFRVERRQENKTAETNVVTLHLVPLDKDECDVTSLKVNLRGAVAWAEDLDPERFGTVEVAFGTIGRTSKLEEHE
ncbi:MAG: hypothetical protein V3U45_08340 [bacterium]